jgi:photosystem II stability/assembly factor-like uncharacterized protein
LGILLTINGCSDDDNAITGPVGWAIGWRSDNTAAILHTWNGGKTWEEQGNTALWTGLSGNDISAVDEWTAWAALGSGDGGGGAILHTNDGGANWRVQTLPEGVKETIKGIKGLSRSVAWAVTLGGTVMRTLDGGENWVVVPHEGITIKQVNRMDAMGEDIWIADFGSSIIHVRLVNGEVISDIMDPTGKYQYEGVTCFDEKTVWVVGFKAYGVGPSYPEGVILHTSDGTTWTSQPLPVNDVTLWKVSFVGAHR